MAARRQSHPNQIAELVQQEIAEEDDVFARLTNRAGLGELVEEEAPQIIIPGEEPSADQQRNNGGSMPWV